jgi:hypothetical protein
MLGCMAMSVVLPYQTVLGVLSSGVSAFASLVV